MSKITRKDRIRLPNRSSDRFADQIRLQLWLLVNCFSLNYFSAIICKQNTTTKKGKLRNLHSHIYNKVSVTRITVFCDFVPQFKENIGVKENS